MKHLLLAGNTSVRSPILFEPNRGQASGSALFVAPATGFRLLLDAGGAVFDFGTSQGRLDFGGKLNSADSPAERGSIIVLYATGEGETNPSGVDGRLNEFDKIEDFPRSLQAVKVTIGGQDADVLFAAGAPGFLAGLMQLNVRVPAGVQAGASVPVVLSVGTVASPPVTLAVR